MDMQLINVSSQFLKREVPVNVFVPDDPTGKWLLLLHGYGGDENEWIKKSYIVDLAKEYGVVLCAPSCGDNYYLDVGEPMGYFLGKELPTFIAKNFPVSSKRQDSYIAGVSMGAFGSLMIGARYSDVYGKIVAFGGAFIIHDIAIGNPAIVGGADINYFRRVFGDFSTLEGSERDPLWHIRKAVKENRMGAVWLLCGTGDALCRSNKRLYEDLKEMGVSVDLLSVSGAHNWPTWIPYLKIMMDWLVNQP